MAENATKIRKKENYINNPDKGSNMFEQVGGSTSVQAISSAPAAAPSVSPESPDISRNTIIVLVMLTLIISVLGTWTVLNEVSGVKVSQKALAPAPAQGEVKLTILTQEEYEAQNRPAQDASTGYVVFNIEQPH